jgi:hypothetical protein
VASGTGHGFHSPETHRCRFLGITGNHLDWKEIREKKYDEKKKYLIGSHEMDLPLNGNAP